VARHWVTSIFRSSHGLRKKNLNSSLTVLGSLKVSHTPKGPFKEVQELRHRSETSTVPGIPFQHALKKLSSDSCTSLELIEIYEALLNVANVAEAPAHNVIIVKEWILVIPRLRAKSGNLAANAAAMVGMVWVNTKEDLQEWIVRGPMKMLREFGATGNLK
jgi:ATP adenylyltransferase/5',5'''-P-1,P-4-tetraphosphate phosphorylase II